MKITVFGIGGVGGIVGGALANHHPETYFYVRGRNLEAIRQGGLRVQSVSLGDFTAHPRLASDRAEELGVMDTILLACKGYDLQAACEAIAPMVGPQTIVIPLLNGVMVSEMMAPRLPPCILADGTINVFSRLEAPGHIVQSAGRCKITFGMKDGSRPAGFEALAAILNGTGIATALSEDILLDSWTKYTLMCGNSAGFCHYDGPAGRVQEAPDHRAVLRAIYEELIAVAAARGVILPADMAERNVDEFDRLPPETMSSLYRDLSSGKPAGRTELFHIIGRMVELGEQTGTATPYHRAVLEKFAGQG